MDLSSLLISVSSMIPSKYLKEFASGQLIPTEDDVEKITHYLIVVYPSLKNETILKQNAALLKVPYLQYLDLDQIQYWEAHYGNDIKLLLNLYVAQGFFHSGIRRVRWDKENLSYYYTDSPRGIGLVRPKYKLKSHLFFKIFWLVSFILLAIISKTAIAIAISGSVLFFSFAIFRDEIMTNTTQNIINEYPNLIKGFKE